MNIFYLDVSTKMLINEDRVSFVVSCPPVVTVQTVLPARLYKTFQFSDR